MLDKILYGQFGATHIFDDGVEERQAAVLLFKISGDDTLVFPFISLLLPPAILLVWPGETQAIALAYSLAFEAVETIGQCAITTDFSLCKDVRKKAPSRDIRNMAYACMSSSWSRLLTLCMRHATAGDSTLISSRVLLREDDKAVEVIE